MKCEKEEGKEPILKFSSENLSYSNQIFFIYLVILVI